MTVQTISVPLTTLRSATTRAAGEGDPLAAATFPSPCPEFGRCDRDACGQSERVSRHCPSLEAPVGQG